MKKNHSQISDKKFYILLKNTDKKNLKSFLQCMILLEIIPKL